MRILFVGNSFTSRNNLPGLLAGLAEQRGIVVEHRLISAGGASLRQHLNAGAAEKAKGFDTVVLQEQSTLPAKNPARMLDSVRDFAAATERLALYLTWARKGGDQQPITQAYAAAAAETGATLIPVGMVWERFLKTHPEPLLHDQDGSHPALAGSYLAACVFLISLLEEDPVGLEAPVKGLTADTAALLREEAWSICEALANGN